MLYLCNKVDQIEAEYEDWILLNINYKNLFKMSNHIDNILDCVNV